MKVIGTTTLIVHEIPIMYRIVQDKRVFRVQYFTDGDWQDVEDTNSGETFSPCRSLEKAIERLSSYVETSWAFGCELI